MLDFDDGVCQGQGARPVGDHDHGAVLHVAGQSLVDQPLALHVDLAGGLVEDQDFGIAEEGAGQRDPLPLAAGEPEAVGADHGPVALGKLGDELVGMGLAGGRLDLLVGGVPAAIADVVEDVLTALPGVKADLVLANPLEEKVKKIEEDMAKVLEMISGLVNNSEEMSQKFEEFSKQPAEDAIGTNRVTFSENMTQEQIRTERLKQLKNSLK